MVHYQHAPSFFLQWGSGGHPDHRSGRSRVCPGGVETEVQDDGQESCDLSGVAEMSGLKKKENFKHSQNWLQANVFSVEALVHANVNVLQYISGVNIWVFILLMI